MSELEKMIRGVTEAYCEAEGIPFRAQTNAGEREEALRRVRLGAEADGYKCGLLLLGPSLNPFQGALADAWETGRQRGQVDAFRRAGAI